MWIDYKNKYVKEFISIGTPFLGAPATIKNILGGDLTFEI